MFQLRRDGYLVLEGLFNDKEVEEMKEAGLQLTKDIPPKEQRAVFSTTQSPQVQWLRNTWNDQSKLENELVVLENVRQPEYHEATLPAQTTGPILFKSGILCSFSRVKINISWKAGIRWATFSKKALWTTTVNFWWPQTSLSTKWAIICTCSIPSSRNIHTASVSVKSAGASALRTRLFSRACTYTRILASAVRVGTQSELKTS